MSLQVKGQIKLCAVKSIFLRSSKSISARYFSSLYIIPMFVPGILFAFLITEHNTLDRVVPVPMLVLDRKILNRKYPCYYWIWTYYIVYESRLCGCRFSIRSLLDYTPPFYSARYYD